MCQHCYVWWLLDVPALLFMMPAGCASIIIDEVQVYRYFFFNEVQVYQRFSSRSPSLPPLSFTKSGCAGIVLNEVLVRHNCSSRSLLGVLHEAFWVVPHCFSRSFPGVPALFFTKLSGWAALFFTMPTECTTIVLHDAYWVFQHCSSRSLLSVPALFSTKLHEALFFSHLLGVPSLSFTKPTGCTSDIPHKAYWVRQQYSSQSLLGVPALFFTKSFGVCQ